MTDTFRLRDGSVEWRMVDDELVALDTQGSMYLAGNRSAAALWPKLVEGASREQLVAALLERFDVDMDQASGDVDAFLANLRERGLLES